jgi:hypothetical protein
MRSHTGATIMMGKGALCAKSITQKLNSKSSTKAEVIAASDFLSQTIWTRYFIEAQGHVVVNNDFYQDNMSAMLLETNGRASAGQRSRHINIRYFFIKDRIATGDIHLLHCPTANMIADFFTKPLQGHLFRKFRDVVMGVTHYSSLDITPTSIQARSVLESTILREETSTDDGVELEDKIPLLLTRERSVSEFDHTEAPWTTVLGANKKKNKAKENDLRVVFKTHNNMLRSNQ